MVGTFIHGCVMNKKYTPTNIQGLLGIQYILIIHVLQNLWRDDGFYDEPGFKMRLETRVLNLTIE